MWDTAETAQQPLVVDQRVDEAALLGNGRSEALVILEDQEFEVFRLFGEGKTAKEIAGQLNLSPKTVSVHRDHIKEKMEYATSAEMIRQAVRWVESQDLGAR